MNSDYKIKNVCCIGAGYVGGPTMAVFADKCPNIKFVVVDKNQYRIDGWNSKNSKALPVFEPGLEEIIRRTRGRNLFFTSDLCKSISDSDMIFISVNTPTKEKGLGAGQASDIKWVEVSAREIAKYAKGFTIVVEKSTMPVRTAKTIKDILSAAENYSYKTKSFSVLSNPEFLAEGTAINDLENPERVLVGGDDKESIELLSSLYSNWVDPVKIIKTNLWSSELSKLAANAFLAQRVSSINSIGALCELTGANISDVAHAIGADSRIGNKFLNAGPGFGGSCFRKDLLNLSYLSRHFGLPEVANYWESVINLNNWQRNRISKIVVEKLFGTLSGKIISIFGVSFKANTNDTRDSPSIQVIQDLLEEGALLKIHDPKVSAIQIEEALKVKQTDFTNEAFLQNSENSYWLYSESLDNALTNSDAAIFLTDWEDYKNIEWNNLNKLMRVPAWIFDCRDIISRKDVINSKLNYWKLGEGQINLQK